METKLDDLDTIDIDGYDFLSQSRKQKYVRKSGGLGVFIKHSLAPYVSIVESDSVNSHNLYDFMYSESDSLT